MLGSPSTPIVARDSKPHVKCPSHLDDIPPTAAGTLVHGMSHEDEAHYVAFHERKSARGITFLDLREAAAKFHAIKLDGKSAGVQMRGAAVVATFGVLKPEKKDMTFEVPFGIVFSFFS